MQERGDVTPIFVEVLPVTAACPGIELTLTEVHGIGLPVVAAGLAFADGDRVGGSGLDLLRLPFVARLARSGPPDIMAQEWLYGFVPSTCERIMFGAREIESRHVEHMSIRAFVTLLDVPSSENVVVTFDIGGALIVREVVASPI